MHSKSAPNDVIVTSDAFGDLRVFGASTILDCFDVILPGPSAISGQLRP